MVATGKKPSLFTRFKAERYFFPLKPEWIIFSEGTPECDKLEKIAIEKNGEVGIEFYKKYGIHASEKDEAGETFKAVKEAEKAYFGHLQKVSQKTGISKGDLQQIINTSSLTVSVLEDYLLEVGTQVGEAESTETRIDAAIKIQETIREIKRKQKEENKESIADVEVYLGELNDLNQKLSDARDDYYRKLICIFLGSAHRIPVIGEDSLAIEFSIEEINRLHTGFIQALFADYIFPEMNGWPEPEKEPEKEPTPEEKVKAEEEEKKDASGKSS